MALIVYAGSTFVDVVPGPGQLASMGTSIDLEWTPCTFGGTRPWFLCPECHNRFAVLHYRHIGFQCRTCQQLAYASSHASKVERRRLKLERIAKKAGITYQSAERPTGMSWDRWESYLAEYKVTVESTFWEFTRWVDPYDAWRWL